MIFFDMEYINDMKKALGTFCQLHFSLIPVATQFRVHVVLDPSKTGIVGSNSGRSMDYIRIFVLCSPVYVQTLRYAYSSCKKSYQNVSMIHTSTSSF
jgi:hypothetical protein